MTAPSEVGGLISPGEVLARAQYWNVHPPPTGYDQGNSTPDPAGKRYRSDCSGFVSMCWHLPSSLTTASIATGTVQIAPSSLQAGDAICASSALNGGSGHVVLFDHWIDTGHRTYLGHDFGSGAAPLHRVIPYPYFPRDSRRYLAYHYPGLGGSFVPPPYADTGVDSGGGGGVVVGIPTRTVYDTPGEYWWNKPDTGTWANFILVAGGGTGGIGDVYVPGDALAPNGEGQGGAGGGGGGIVIASIPLDLLDATDNQVTVGAGGSINGPNRDGESSYFAFSLANPGTQGYGTGGHQVGGGGGGNLGDGVTGTVYPGQDGSPPSSSGPGGGGGGVAGAGAPGGPGGTYGWGSAGTTAAPANFAANPPFVQIMPDDAMSGYVVIETGGDRVTGEVFAVGDIGTTQLVIPGSSSGPPPPHYLRMTQRNDGLGIDRHPRLTGTGTNTATSVQSTRSIRLGTDNRYL